MIGPEVGRPQGRPVYLSEVPDPRPGYCSCESAYCSQHGGNADDPAADYPSCEACPNVPEGHFTMDWLGVVCDECAKVAIAHDFGYSIHEVIQLPYPDHVRHRREALEARRAHLRDAPPTCRCFDHVGGAALRAELDARIAAERARNGEPPF